MLPPFHLGHPLRVRIYDMGAIVKDVNSKKQWDTSPVSDTIPYKLGIRPNLCWSTLAYGFCIIAG